MKTSALSTPPSGYKPPTQGQVNAATDLVSRFAKSWNQPTADGLRDLMHADTENLIPPMMKPADREGVVEHFRQVLNQLPDWRLDVQRWALAGDSVMIEWRASATVAGAPLQWMGIDVIRIRAIVPARPRSIGTPGA